MKRSLSRVLPPIAMAALISALTGSAIAQAPAKKEPAKKHAPDVETRYQAGSSPLAEQELHHNINPRLVIEALSGF